MNDCARERVFVLVIDEVPILAFEARSMSEALELGREVWLLEDLKRLTSGRIPLWDGKAPIRTRSARSEEIARYRGGVDEGQAIGDELPLLFLVAIDSHLEVAAPAAPGAFPPHR
jgi:hypothetical protein